MGDMAVEYARHRVSIDEYHRMAEYGIFDPDSRIELIDGELIERMTPPKPPHSQSVSVVTSAFFKRFGDIATVLCQDAVTLPGDSEPQPDIAIVKPNDYWTRHPSSEDIFLVVEVALTSRDYDRRVKMPLYARARIPEAWLIDLPKGMVQIYRDPVDGEYTSVHVAHRGDTISPLAFPDEAFHVSAFLPPV